MTYATPVTPAQFAALVDGIGTWPANCEDQGGAYNDLVARLEAIALGWTALQGINLHIVKDSVPSLNDWQSAWERSGRTLPIVGNVRGLHESRTLDPVEIQEYFWYDGQMKPMRARWWRGSSEISNPFPYVAQTTLNTTEAKIMDIPIVMKRPGWINFVTPLAAIYTTTDTNVRWRTSQEAVDATYGLIRTKINTLSTFASGMVHALLQYKTLTRLSSAFVGNLSIWARKEGSTVTLGNQDPLLFLDYIPGYVENIYD